LSADGPFLFEPVDVDTTSVEMLADLPDLYAFEVVLSGCPDPLWKRVFEDLWKRSRYLNKYDAVVLEESIRFICAKGQGMEDYLYLIESRIRAANEIVRCYWEKCGVEAILKKYQRYPLTFLPIGTIR
jgi:hypothetical protein